jgi:hypothetical protein
MSSCCIFLLGHPRLCPAKENQIHMKTRHRASNKTRIQESMQQNSSFIDNLFEKNSNLTAK